MRERFEAVLEAEQAAAAAAARRLRTIRDLLLEAEDREDDIAILLASGRWLRGTVAAVGVDNLFIKTGTTEVLVALSAVHAAVLR